jgi:hypothetical protein
MVFMLRRASLRLTSRSESGRGAKNSFLKYSELTSLIRILSLRPRTASSSCATSRRDVTPSQTML